MIGIEPITIRESAEDSAATEKPASINLFSPKPDLVDLILFSRQMYTLIKAGVPIIRAIRGLGETQRKPIIRDALGEVAGDLESGRDLASALARHPKIFSPLFISLVRVGEQTGGLDQAFLQLTHYLELDKEIRDRIKAAMRYPSFVAIAIVAAIVILNIFVIPTFAGVFSGFKTELPLMTKVLIGTSNFFLTYWPYMLAGSAGLVFGIRHYVQSDAGAAAWDKYKLRIPIVGDIVHRATLGRFARAFSMTLRAGVPIAQALGVVAQAVDNRYIAGFVMDMRSGIERGDSLTRTAAATGMFTPLVMQMLNVGEESGAVDELLEEVAVFYEREVEYDLKGLSSAIEPILTAVIGVIVLLLAMGIFLPMWDLGSAALGKK